MNGLVPLVQKDGQDFEFYPTTDEIISALIADLTREDEHRYRRRDYSSVLDIGAGDGKVLKALRDRAGMTSLHAIEKSTILCEQLDPEILIVGTDFAEQSLLSKHVDVIFCNPPYSQFEEWAVKIIRQAASRVVYLVVPTRWTRSVAIADAIRYRDADCAAIGQFDFENAEDRRARAKVDLLRIRMKNDDAYSRDSDDAFDRFFQEQFGPFIGKFDNDKKQEGEERPPKFGDLVVGPGYVESLVAVYDAQIAKVQRNFELVGQLDADLLREFNIKPAVVRECLKIRLSGLRSEYWQELFSHLDTVTNRLTSESRKRLLDVLHKHVHVDFTVSNIYAVMIWVIKNANIYIDSQLISTYELMVDKCNVVLYKSNQRTWVDERWRYRDEPSKNSHYGLDYRIVTHRAGGISLRYSGSPELDERAADFLGDLLTIARNLGFDCVTNPVMLSRAGRDRWTPGQVHEFHGLDKRGNSIVLIEARAYKNGNVHLRFAKQFILALNVEHGRLKGWLHSRAEAAEELKDTNAAQYFRANALIGVSPQLLLCPPASEQAQADSLF